MKDRLRQRPRFIDERAGQLDFFAKFGIDPTLADYTDGVYLGSLFEFKLRIERPSQVLSQAIKYLSRMRNLGKSIPAHILLVDVNAEVAYCYRSADYLTAIEVQYQGPASRGNRDFAAADPAEVIDYGDFSGRNQLSAVIGDESHVRVHIDLYDVVGWAERFYRERPTASKSEMFDELRTPAQFRDLIYPWTGADEDFAWIMDCLNDRQHRRELGAFYTPSEYALMSAGPVRRAIEAVPVTDCVDADCVHRYEHEREHKHYVIVDRCAGTGNLEEALSEEELSHTIASTYELKEWVVLNSRFGGRVRAIVPLAPDHEQGLLTAGDALAQDVFEEVRPYVDDGGCAVILYENPPYSDASGDTARGGVVRGQAKTTVVAANMRREFSPRTKGLQPTKDLANQFIWSAWRHYLTGPHDAYVLFAPIKYWKTHELCDRRFVDGYIFNRRHFHATPSAITCILWTNEEDRETEAITLKAFDIVDGETVFVGTTTVRKARVGFSEGFFDKRRRPADADDGIYCGRDGSETGRKPSTSVPPVYGDDIIAWLHSVGFAIAGTNVGLTRAALPLRNNGFFLRRDNYLAALPLFAAKRFPQARWHERDLFVTSADGGDAYAQDPEFLQACFVWACLSTANHCLSLDGSDGRHYRNELCFDAATTANVHLRTLTPTEAEQRLLATWEDVICTAWGTGDMNPGFTYGPYQLDLDINVRHRDENGQTVYEHPVLNDKLARLKAEVAAFYQDQVVPGLFRYELLK